MEKPSWLTPHLYKGRYWQSTKPLRRWIEKSATFFNLHLMYIITVGLLGAVAIWVGPQGTGQRISFTNALFNAFSSVCGCGSVTVYMATFSGFGEAMLMVLMMLGSNVATSIWPVLIRIYYFRKYSLERYKIDPLQEDAANIAVNEYTIFPVERSQELKANRAPTPEDQDTIFSEERSRELTANRAPTLNDPEWEEIHSLPASGNSRRLSATGHEGMPHGTQTRNPRVSEASAQSAYTYNPNTMKRRMGFLGLPHKEHPNAEAVFQHLSSLTVPDPNKADHIFTKTGDQTEVEVGYFLDIIELNALLQLSWLVPTYFVALQALGFALTCITLQLAPGERHILETKNGVNPWFFALFQTSCAFNQAGFCLLDDQYIQLQRATVFLLIQSTLILLGNTMFPVALYGIIWLLQRFLKDGDRKDALNYLLKHPRHCFTHLFPWEETKWLLWTIILFNCVELAFFLGLDWDTPALDNLSPFHKFSVGLAQSIGTRSAGFSYISLAAASPAMWILYLGFMYVAVYPVHFARVNSRVSQPDSQLGIGIEANVINYLSHNSTLVQGWMLIARDSSLVFAAMLLVCVFEREKLRSNPVTYDVFKIMFEIVSLYGTVGLSLGVSCNTPNCVAPPYSFVGAWGTPSKMVAIFVLLAGRHRTLPNNIDYSVVIPKRVKERRKEMRQLKRQETDRLSQRSLHKNQSLVRRPTMTDLKQMFRNKGVAESEENEVSMADLNESFDNHGGDEDEEEGPQAMREEPMGRTQEENNAHVIHSQV